MQKWYNTLNLVVNDTCLRLFLVFSTMTLSSFVRQTLLGNAILTYFA